jgi:hypothetical protein
MYLNYNIDQIHQLFNKSKSEFLFITKDRWSINNLTLYRRGQTMQKLRQTTGVLLSEKEEGVVFVDDVYSNFTNQIFYQ